MWESIRVIRRWKCLVCGWFRAGRSGWLGGITVRATGFRLYVRLPTGGGIKPVLV
jgi:hypothetical protein